MSEIKLNKVEKKGISIIDKLNPEQKEAVTTINGQVLIIAGAGSGKTRVITHRIAYMIENGIRPDSILALTFTNKAAGEMKERIGQLVPPDAATRVWAGTFHSVFARILRTEAHRIGYSSNFSIYDQDDSLSAIKSVFNSLGINNQVMSPQNVRARISSAKNKMISAAKFFASAESPSEKSIAQIYEEYENYLRKNNAMDFDDLLLNMIKVLQNHPDALSYYQNKFRYIMVDEYQDTNKAQYVSVSLLAKSHQNICVVGDDAQSIYRWRGADIQNILDFQKAYPYSKVIKLEQNYRSTKNIISAADEVIKNNRHQLKKKIWTNNPEGEKLNLENCYNDREEADKIAKIIQEHIKNGRKLGEIAVLYRTNAQSLLIENSLRRVNLPYIIIGGISFYKRKEIKDVLAYLRLLINPNDDEALTRIVNEPPRGLGATSIKYIKLYASMNKISLLNAFSEAGKIEELQKRAQNAAVNFAVLFNNAERFESSQNQWAEFYEFIEKTGYISMLKELQTEESEDRLNNIEQLFTDIQRFFEDNPELQLSDYLQQISLVSDVDEKIITYEKVTLMTVHSAKGLEFPIVIISGLEQGLFPLERPEMHPEEKEEERRLFYVALTRAKEKLHLTYSEIRSRFGVNQNQNMSQFIKEIPKKLLNSGFESYYKSEPQRNINSFKPAPKPVRNEYSQISNYNDYSQLPGNSGFRPGDIVKHSQFGRGKILNLSGVGQTQKAEVNFDSVGRKSLLLHFAKLEKL